MTVSISYWVEALLLVGMATFALIEVKSSSLIPKSLFIWPACGALYGFFVLLAAIFLNRGTMHDAARLVLGIAFLLCSLQAFVVNIRKLSPWPSGMIWLGVAVAGLMFQGPVSSLQEPLFQTFVRRLIGLVWASVGVMKIVSEKTVSQEGSIPVWIKLLYIQAILTASESA